MKGKVVIKRISILIKNLKEILLSQRIYWYQGQQVRIYKEIVIRIHKKIQWEMSICRKSILREIAKHSNNHNFQSEKFLRSNSTKLSFHRIKKWLQDLFNCNKINFKTSKIWIILQAVIWLHQTSRTQYITLLFSFSLKISCLGGMEHNFSRTSCSFRSSYSRNLLRRDLRTEMWKGTESYRSWQEILNLRSSKGR